jgi:hypothetical protein
MLGSGLQTSGLSGRQATAAKNTSDIKLDTPAADQNQNNTQTTSPLPKPKRANFGVRKEDPALLSKLASDEQGQAGTFNGASSYIDGYLRINKRRYGRRGPYVR